MPEAQKREMELLSIGADLYFQKPFVEDRFIDDLQRLLRSGRRPAMTPVPDEETINRDVEAEKRAWKESQDAIAQEVGVTRKPKGPPPQFSGYSILKVIGGGAMGTVYKARDEKNDRLVALKVFLRDPSDKSDSFERFQREALIMRELDHSNIVRVYETGHTGFTYNISMEFMDGGSLIDFPETRIDEDFVAKVICRAGSALAYMHAKGVIHRDIKPGNILLGKDGSAKLGDFGISRAHLEVDRREFTSQEMLIGTRIYMAPELFMGGKADELTDQYAFGRTILRLFEGDHASMPPRELKKLGKPFPEAFSDALARCMAVDRMQRFGSIREACEHLKRALGRRCPAFNP
jgi:serine/threonine-protein kinase